MKMIQAYAVGDELFRTHQEALVREREIALRELMNGLDHWGFIKKFCINEEFRKRVQEISDMGVMIKAEKFAEKVPCFGDFILKNKITGTEDSVCFATYYKKVSFDWGLHRSRYISGTSRYITNYQRKHDKYLFNVYIRPLTLFNEHEYFGLERVLEESTVFFFDKLNHTFYVEDEHIEGFLEALNNWYVDAVEELKHYQVKEEIEELKSRLLELTGGKDSDE